MPSLEKIPWHTKLKTWLISVKHPWMAWATCSHRQTIPLKFWRREARYGTWDNGQHLCISNQACHGPLGSIHTTPENRSVVSFGYKAAFCLWCLTAIKWLQPPGCESILSEPDRVGLAMSWKLPGRPNKRRAQSSGRWPVPAWTSP